MTNTKPVLRLRFVDTQPGIDAFFMDLLTQQYTLDQVSPPDFIIYSNFGDKYLDYDCVRIFFTGENVRPDFNVCDYALGFDWLQFEDRYMRLPLYRLYTEDYTALGHMPHYTAQDVAQKKHFCNFIYSNKLCPERDAFFKELSQYKPVVSGGRHLNNIGAPVADKQALQAQCEFSIAFENTETPGYTSEKLLQAKRAGTVPIYWGNPVAAREFNSQAFINVHDFASSAAVIEEVRRLDTDPVAYLAMLNAPLFLRQQEQLSDTVLLKYFVHIFSQAKPKRRHGRMYEQQIEANLRIARQYNHSRLRRLLWRFLPGSQ